MTRVQKRLRRDPFTLIALLMVVAVLVFVTIRLGGQISSRLGSEKSDNTVIGWGSDDTGQLGRGSLSNQPIAETAKSVEVAQVTQVAAGLRHNLALDADGAVWSWGSNKYGQLGNGKLGGIQVTPAKIEGLPSITMVATRQDSNLALDTQGRVWAWGMNISGQVGDGSNTDQPKPHQVRGLSGVKFITTGYRSSLAVKTDGTVWTWGGNCKLQERTPSFRDYVAKLAVNGYADTEGGTMEHITPEDDCIQEKYLNIKSSSPKQVTGLPAVDSVSAGFGHILAVTKDGEVWSWGCNLFGQVGNGIDHNSEANLQPAKVEGLDGIRQVSAGFRHSVALSRDGKLWAWGHNYFGELGNGKDQDTSITSAPQPITVAKNIDKIYAGHDYTLARMGDGQLWGWGQASFGQLGGIGEYKARPARILQLEQVSSAAAGGGHVIAITSDKVN